MSIELALAGLAVLEAGAIGILVLLAWRRERVFGRAETVDGEAQLAAPTFFTPGADGRTFHTHAFGKKPVDQDARVTVHACGCGQRIFRPKALR